jgi:uncharacterized membrane protein YvbJ
MFCSKCGHKNEMSASQFCAQCGGALGSATPYGTVTAAESAPKPVMANLAIIFACVSLLFLPILFGPAAFVLGIIAVVQKQKNAVLGLVLACTLPIVGAVIGFMIGLASF